MLKKNIEAAGALGTADGACVGEHEGSRLGTADGMNVGLFVELGKKMVGLIVGLSGLNASLWLMCVGMTMPT